MGSGGRDLCYFFWSFLLWMDGGWHGMVWVRVFLRTMERGFLCGYPPFLLFFASLFTITTHFWVTQQTDTQTRFPFSLLLFCMDSFEGFPWMGWFSYSVFWGEQAVVHYMHTYIFILWYGKSEGFSGWEVGKLGTRERQKLFLFSSSCSWVRFLIMHVLVGGQNGRLLWLKNGCVVWFFCVSPLRLTALRKNWWMDGLGNQHLGLVDFMIWVGVWVMVLGYCLLLVANFFMNLFLAGGEKG